MNPLSRAAGALLAAFLFATAHAAAPEPSDVIAESARARLTIADYEAEIAKLPPDARGEFAASSVRLRQYLDTLYTNRALAADARSLGLDKDPVLSRQIATQVDKILAQAMVDRIEAAAAAEFDKSADKYAARVRELYQVNRSRYAYPERVRAAHILVAIKDGNRDAALARAEEIRAKALAGADFGKLAREYSDDSTAAKNGGELGFFDAKTMDSAFATAAFAMTRKGEISAPVLTKFGYHVILLEDRKPAGVRTFEEVKPELLADQKSKAISEAKAAETRRIFSDPTLKVNVELIERLNTDSAIRSDSSGILSPAKKP